VPAIEVGPDSFLTSLRNNAFYDHPTNFSAGTAIVRPGFFEKKTTPAPMRLGYADYNLFFNPDAKEKQNYALAVKDKTERTDSGFAKNDVQIDPKFTGPIPKKFPFKDEDIRSGKVAVSEILAQVPRRVHPGGRQPADRCRRPGRWRERVYRRRRRRQEPAG